MNFFSFFEVSLIFFGFLANILDMIWGIISSREGFKGLYRGSVDFGSSFLREFR